MSRRVSVHHFVLTEVTKPHSPSWRVSDLFGVSHWRDVPPDTEFPRTIARMQLFTRFYLQRARPTEFWLRVAWFRRHGEEPAELDTFGPYVVPFARDAVARDYSFNLHYVRLQGVGLHRIELLREPRIGSISVDFVPIARTYFIVER